MSDAEVIDAIRVLLLGDPPALCETAWGEGQSCSIAEAVVDLLGMRTEIDALREANLRKQQEAWAYRRAHPEEFPAASIDSILDVLRP